MIAITDSWYFHDADTNADFKQRLMRWLWFYDIVSISDYIVRMVGWLVNDKLIRIWREVVVA
jgi:hypothetical protein